MEITLKPKEVTRAFALCVVFLVLAHIAMQAIRLCTGRDTVYGLVPMLDLGRERNLPAFYSSIAILVCSVFLTIIGAAKRKQKEPYALHWLALAAIFLFLSADEALGLHELWYEAVKSHFKLSGFLYAGWVIPYGLAVLLLGVTFWRFLMKLPARTRRLFIVAGAIYVVGALCMEMVGGKYLEMVGGVDTPDDQRGVAWVIYATIEETLEMAGIVVFIYALTSYIDEELRALRIRIAASPEEP